MCPDLTDKPEPTPLRVDFLGPPGVGKSTLCDLVLAESDNWHSFVEARRLATLSLYTESGKMRPLERLRTVVAALKHCLLEVVWRGSKRPFVVSRNIERMQSSSLEAFLMDHHKLVSTLVDQWHDPDMPLACLPTRYWELLTRTREILLVMSWKYRARILADNARFTRGAAELLSNASLSREQRELMVKSYLNCPLAPAAVINVHGSSELIVRRINNRGKETGQVNVAHEGLTNSELRAYTDRRIKVNQLAADFFRDNGTPVLGVDAQQSLKSNVTAVRHFLAQVC